MEAIEEIPKEECLEILQTKSKVGRVAFIEDGKPMILPVNYRADAESVVFCTADGTRLSYLKDGAPAAFEVDSSRNVQRSGWSVLVQGAAEEVTDPEELYELRHGPLKSWAVDSSAHWIRISIEKFSGRKIPES